MARAREFDPEAALNAAMLVFWRNGYFATSIDDLVGATGVSRYGLYGVYENKQGLFLAALDLYMNTVVRELASVLHAPGADLDTVRTFVRQLGAISADPSGQRGCLLWNTASEVAPHDPAVARKVEEFRTYLTSGFRHALKNAQDHGKVAPNFPVDREADFLSGVVQNLAVLARSRAGAEATANFVETALSTLH
ncbi:MAG: TetR/AcrR family transcriptional regulator [Sphingomonadales bacterium]|nr:TetR/AcrR family transcriptional regulator [Sphingomonadales bacterium]